MVYSNTHPDVELWAMLGWHVGDVVRKMRQARDWNQNTLAKKAHVSKATVVRLEAGRDTNTSTMQSIAKAFGVPVSVLFDLIPQDKEVGASASARFRSAQ